MIYLLTEHSGPDFSMDIQAFEKEIDAENYKNYLYRESSIYQWISDEEETRLDLYKDGYIPKEQWNDYREVISKINSMIICTPFNDVVYTIQAINLVKGEIE